MDGNVYAVGGENEDGDATATMDAFDPAEGAWIQLAEMATARESFCVECIDGKLFAVGGNDDDGRPLASAEVFNPVAGTWAQTAANARGTCMLRCRRH